VNSTISSPVTVLMSYAAQDLDAGDFLDHGFHERRARFHQLRADFLEQFLPLSDGAT